MHKPRALASLLALAVAAHVSLLAALAAPAKNELALVNEMLNAAVTESSLSATGAQIKRWLENPATVKFEQAVPTLEKLDTLIDKLQGSQLCDIETVGALEAAVDETVGAQALETADAENKLARVFKEFADELLARCNRELVAEAYFAFKPIEGKLQIEFTDDENDEFFDSSDDDVDLPPLEDADEPAPAGAPLPPSAAADDEDEFFDSLDEPLHARAEHSDDEDAFEDSSSDELGDESEPAGAAGESSLAALLGKLRAYVGSHVSAESVWALDDVKHLQAATKMSFAELAALDESKLRALYDEHVGRPCMKFAATFGEFFKLLSANNALVARFYPNLGDSNALVGVMAQWAKACAVGASCAERAVKNMQQFMRAVQADKEIDELVAGHESEQHVALKPRVGEEAAEVYAQVESLAAGRGECKLERAQTPN